MPFTPEDLAQMRGHHIDERKAQAQLERFKSGFPWLKIVSPATPGRGIAVLDEDGMQAMAAVCDSAKVAGKCKFVPASGAASRMFKDMFSAWEGLRAGKTLPSDAPAVRLASRIGDFPFYDPARFGQEKSSSDCGRVLSAMLSHDALDMGAKPKGVLPFHRYADEVRTALAEHLVEAQAYLRGEDGTCTLHFTVSPEHLNLFKEALQAVQSRYERRYGVRYKVSFSFQDPSTDTIAADADNQPFRTDEGRLLFRPGGHGALIHNLGEIAEELVCIKNIDNVCQEKLLPITSRCKRALMGYALTLRDQIFAYLRKLDEQPSAALCAEIEAWLDKTLCIRFASPCGDQERVRRLRAKLDRPIRVCGMVRNEGEPGGGPYVVEGKDGCTGLQILESVQINPDDPEAMQAMKGATHFNPVDLVCLLHNAKGERFDLSAHVDEDAGFISSKSYQGRPLKALELPGLWNGAMSDWNTCFVEVPSETFNPVKTVLDLLRPAHQA